MLNQEQNPTSDLENASIPHSMAIEKAENDPIYDLHWSLTFKMKSTQEEFEHYFRKEKRQQLIRWCSFILCLDLLIFFPEYMHSFPKKLWKLLQFWYLIVSMVSASCTVFISMRSKTCNLNFLAHTNFCFIALGTPVLTIAFFSRPEHPIVFLMWFYIFWYGVFVGFSVSLHINLACICCGTFLFFWSVGYTTAKSTEIQLPSHLREELSLAVLCILVTAKFVYATLRLNFKLFITFQVLKKNKEQELHRLYAIKKQYISQTLHDIGTPLTTLALGQEILEQIPLPDETKEIILTNKCAIEMMILTRKKALDFAKFDQTGNLVPTISIVDVREILCTKCSRIMTGFNSSPDVILRFWVDENIARSIYSDGDWLWEMLCNLLSNALKFTSEGFVEANVSISGKSLLFEVRDTGKGVSEEGKARLFQPFSQLQCDAGGTGLGLFSVYCRTKALGGNVGVRDNTEEGRGSVFYFTIPYEPVSQQRCSEIDHDIQSEKKQAQILLVKEQQEQKDSVEEISENSFQERNSQPSLSKTYLLQSSCSHVSGIEILQKTPRKENSKSNLFKNTKATKVSPECSRQLSNSSLISFTPLIAEKKRILLIEDEKSIAKFMVQMLERAGFLVDHAPNGRNGLERMKNSDGCYHVVLCDLVMPIMNGFETVISFRQWENDHAQQKDESLKTQQVIIALSASQSQEDQDRALSCGFTSFVSKPVKIKHLLQEIETAVCVPTPAK